jgi:hypothetical protein
MAETRIRWTKEDGGDTAGRVGTLAAPLFFIQPPESPGKAYILVSTLPNHAVDFYPSGFVADVKAKAEEWLTEFTASLGAIFPAEPPMVCTVCRRPVRKVPGIWAPSVWEHAETEDGRACPDLGAHLTGMPVMAMATPGPETTTATAGDKE